MPGGQNDTHLSYLELELLKYDRTTPRTTHFHLGKTVKMTVKLHAELKRIPKGRYGRTELVL